MLFGRFDSVIGEKNRTSLPKKFRDILGDSLIITKGLENCLIITTPGSWNTLLSGIEQKPFTSSDKREVQRFLFGNAAALSLDKLRRFIIPQYLLDYAYITADIVFLGVQDQVEVWDKTQWEKRQVQIAPNVSTIAERLNETIANR